MNDEFYMSLALNEAWKYQFLTYPNPAVGCLILDKNERILSLQAHEKAGTAHAELNAICKALKSLNPTLQIPQEPNLAHDFVCKHHANLLKDATAFVSLEPCNHQGKTPPCARLFTELHFKKVIISTSDTNKIASGGALFLKQHGIEVKMGVLEQRGKELLKPFLKWQNGSFKLFKLALSLNGSALGKEVSSLESRTYAHKIRSKLDLLVIGGQTLRQDRPLLDSRLAGDKAPDLCILSHFLDQFKDQERALSLEELSVFDTTIPLFSVKERKIYAKIPKSAKFIMFEGGASFLQGVKDEMDAFLIFSNSRFNSLENIRLNLHLKPLFKGFLGEDTYGIYERA
ncbi:bifunctional diaminohydroxyphosphoribosylaminopyrimidine deaminase/5-amino-6-(5-phosphoribosylamino)uracil reductase RibD [Campylobacter sp. MIT 99-7217]|uniref:bifunctional diaminohydroxyphosphoribosylaminopyrimidine deaminase/5-amino-6-(5-phosphoribosylamino)uracil reductase RibD n=1 Tax=Campylobacter sp. MIT 99-7217 TaxID=535091 RepID=UPI00115A804F|nr:bifunctional diaminohydroxyphosphoribosylaminopyrimidine deaminase/5-amino-6-(5-phosphoribosylamino)uracil reductase RibD [Campylobacter sp. MIT 99-7217]TQR34471.1 bifunctional diaminohydroxyphosphoribosylaminopyrimidine deaminase/5-amino-6-(5-phosphoribosylamino)uracil reductase RibD [Campylobacter sp. MIT 99-7217]